MIKRIQVDDKGMVRLDAAMADDLSVVNAARVSFARESAELTEVDKGLINFLMRERHGTPFEHNAFRFHIVCPLFVAREWFRHRIGSFNEFSARYSEVPNDYFVPQVEDVRAQVGKPGAYSFDALPKDVAIRARNAIQASNAYTFTIYRELLDMGVAKELARSVLPVSMLTQFYWTVNARSLMNFLSLRTAETAQLDIRRYADAVNVLFEQEMPETHAAWVNNGKVAP